MSADCYSESTLIAGTGIGISEFHTPVAKMDNLLNEVEIALPHEAIEYESRA